MEITQAAPIPEIVQLFTSLLWANSPKDWVLKSTYHKKTLFVSMSIPTSTEEKYQKVRRSFSLNMIHSRSEDLWSLAADCINEMIAIMKMWGNDPGK